MDKEQLCDDLRTLVNKIRSWDCEDICTMYAWMLQVNQIRKAIGDNELVTEIVRPHDLPVGISPTPKNLTNVWTWDNHGRYIVGEHWNENMLKIRRLDDINIE